MMFIRGGQCDADRRLVPFPSAALADIPATSNGRRPESLIIVFHVRLGVIGRASGEYDDFVTYLYCHRCKCHGASRCFSRNVRTQRREPSYLVYYRVGPWDAHVY